MYPLRFRYLLVAALLSIALAPRPALALIRGTLGDSDNQPVYNAPNSASIPEADGASRSENSGNDEQPPQRQLTSTEDNRARQDQKTPSPTPDQLAPDTKLILIAVTFFSVCVVVGFGLTFLSIGRRLAKLQEQLTERNLKSREEGGKSAKAIEDVVKKIELHNLTVSDLVKMVERLWASFNDLKAKERTGKKRNEDFGDAWAPSAVTNNRDTDRIAAIETREADLSRLRHDLERREQSVTQEEADLYAKRVSYDDEVNQLKERSRQIEHREMDASRRLEEAQESTDRSAAELAKAEERMRAAEAKERETETTRQEIINSENKIAEHRRALQVWRSEFWPAAFQDNGPLARQREDLEHKTVDGDPSAALLCLSLARCRVLIKQAVSGSQTDLTELAQSLHDISRLAYLYWRQGGSSPEQQLEFAREWAKAIEADLDNRLSIRIAEIGAVKNQSWMSYSSGGSVTGVNSWGVLSNRGIALQKASVA